LVEIQRNLGMAHLASTALGLYLGRSKPNQHCRRLDLELPRVDSAQGDYRLGI